MELNVNFPPPYKSYQNAAEKAEIEKIITTELNRVKKEVAAAKPKDAKLAILSNASLLNTKNLADARNTLTGLKVQPLQTKAAVNAGINSNALIQNIIPQPPVSSPVQKTTGTDLSVIPNGTINLGYNCDADFTASVIFSPLIPPGNISTFTCDIIFDNSNKFYIGTHTLVESPLPKLAVKFKWKMYYGVYGTQGYPSLKFKIVVSHAINGLPGEILTSETITINFTSTPCINIHNMYLSEGSVKGGDHGTAPVLYVNLNTPAPPGGQPVFLSVTGTTNNNPQAWINSGVGVLTIPGGQTHGEWSSFLGSRKVNANWDIHIKAVVNGKEGVAPLTIRKK